MSTNGSLNFDRATPFYDDTRAFPDDVSQRVMWAIITLSQATRATRFVELGVGSGRIALPLVEWGQRVVGIDVSRDMLLRLREQVPPGGEARLVEADVTHVPLADGTADAVLVVHVLHVVPGWQAALAEARRLLAPGGVLLHSWTRRDPASLSVRMRRHWGEMVAAHSESTLRPGAVSPDEVVAALEAMGAGVQQAEVARWTVMTTPAENLAGVAHRAWSDTCRVSDETLQATLPELQRWAEAEFGDLNAPHVEVRRVVFDVATWPSGGQRTEPRDFAPDLF